MSSRDWEDDLYSGEVGSEVETGVSRFVPHILLGAILLFFIFFFSWAYVASLDEVTRGEAKIIPSSQIQKVQNLEGGIVAAINIREGDIVEKDQVLLRIENVDAAAKLRESRGKYLSLLASIARLEAEATGARDLRFPEEVVTEDPESANDELRLFNARMAQLSDQLNLLRDQVTQKKQEIAEQESRVSQLENAFQLKKEELDLLAPLVRQGVTPRLDMIKVQQQLQDIRMEMEGLKLSIPRSRTSLQETQRRVDEKETSFRTEAQQELNRKKVDVNAVAQTLTAEADKVTRTEVRSPVKGTVNKVHVATVGGVIQPGADLVEIVPLDDTLIVEAKIRPADRAALRPGLNATVKVTAYDFSVHGGLPAEPVGHRGRYDRRRGRGELLPHPPPDGEEQPRTRQADHSGHDRDGRHPHGPEDRARLSDEADPQGPPERAPGTVGPTLRISASFPSGPRAMPPPQASANGRVGG